MLQQFSEHIDASPLTHNPRESIIYSNVEMCGIVNGTKHNRLKEFIVTERLGEFVVVVAAKSSLVLSL